MWHSRDNERTTKVILYVIALLLVIAILILGTLLLNSINEVKQLNNFDLPAVETDEQTQEELYTQLKEYEGRWTGSWTNTTFNTRGDITVDITVQPEGIIVAEYDLEGFVFGWLNPNKRIAYGVYTRDGVFFNVEADYIFGTVRVHAKPDNTIAISGLRIPLRRVNAVTATGTFDTQEAKIDYNVNFFSGNGGSQGVVELYKQAQ